MNPQTKTILAISFVILIVSIASLHFQFCSLFVIAVAVLMNVYLISLLVFAANASDKGRLRFAFLDSIVPKKRLAALILFITFFFCFVLLFATVYFNERENFVSTVLKCKLDAEYYSLTTMTTLGVEGAANFKTDFLKEIVMLNILTALNYFFGAIALLLSRISDF